MKNPFYRRIRRISFRRQLMATLACGILLLLTVSTITNVTFSTQDIRDRLIEEGYQVTETLAAQSPLALIFQSSENIEYFAKALMAYPDILGLAIYDLDRNSLLAMGENNMLPDAIEKWPESTLLIYEDEHAWYFASTVYNGDTDAAADSPFSSYGPKREPIGYVRVTMGKRALMVLTQNIFRNNLTVSSIIAVILFLILNYITLHMTAPIKALAQKMRRAEQGEEKLRAEIGGPKDIVNMQTAFNTMMEVLESRAEDLIKARDDALESARVKGEFTAHITHELRTPLNGVIGMLELLQHTELEAKYHGYLTIAHDSAESLLMLINDILDFSRNEAGKLRLNLADFYLQEMLDDLISLLSSQARAKGLTLGYLIEPTVPHVLYGDADRIRQILINLVGNAVKFTDRGEVIVSIKGIEKNGAIILSFEVKDTGIGICENALKNIFSPFTQEDSTTTREFGGTGLGLTICRQLVEIMGGEIGVESEKEKGSTFRFSIPLLKARNTVETLSDEHTALQGRIWPGARILVVEDSRANQEVAKGMLEKLACFISTARNGREALSAIKNKEFDLVFMDCNMPEMDGYEATRQIRAEEKDGKRLPIIAMTANGQQSDVDKCRKEGMDDYVAKPINIEKVSKILAHWLGQGTVVSDNVIAVTTDAAKDISVDHPLDLRVINELRENIGDAFNRMVEVFLEDIAGYMRAITRAARDSDMEVLADVAHTIKGNAMTFGAMQLADTCRNMEELSRSEYREEATRLVAIFLTEVEAVKEALCQEITPVEQIQISKGFESARILIVDDDRTMRFGIHKAIEHEGYQIFEASDGLEAVNGCRNRMPDLILLDALMPVLDGFSACAQIRKLPGGDRVPVLIVTGLEDEQSIDKAYAAGATDYIAKPVNYAVLRKRMERLLYISRAENYMRHLAYNDSLTGLPNRVQFMERLKGTIVRAKKTGSVLALLFLDLDRFKMINDTLGHDAGDYLLKIVSERIKACIRSTDMVARLGGDEFTVILDDLRSTEMVSNIAEKICAALLLPINFMDQEIFITTSIGISLYPNDGLDIGALMKHADTAMYSAKEGRTQSKFYEDGMEMKISKRLALESDLRRALKREEFVVYYQPQVDLGSGKIIGMEALVRWQHPERGLVPPNDFIPIAEETGCIEEIGEWVLHTSCHQLHSWMHQGFGPLRVAVNLSGRQLEKESLVEKVAEILNETGLPASALELEITESMLMDRNKGILPILEHLNEMGVTLAIDDFGTGYSSLGKLKHFPVDVLKIDRCFVNDIATNRDDLAIITGIIALAKSLGLKAVAEGVEDAEQEQILKDLKCDIMQGFYFSKPIPASVFEQQFLRQKSKILCDSPKVLLLQQSNDIANKQL